MLPSDFDRLALSLWLVKLGDFRGRREFWCLLERFLLSGHPEGGGWPLARLPVLRALASHGHQLAVPGPKGMAVAGPRVLAPAPGADGSVTYLTEGTVLTLWATEDTVGTGAGGLGI